MKKTPVISLVLPLPVYLITFLDEHSTMDADGRSLTDLRWVARLANTDIVILRLGCVEEEILSPRFDIEVTFNTETWNKDSNHHFAADYAIGNSGGHIIWISLLANEYIKLPTYAIAPIRTRDDPPRSVIGGSHISVEHPKTIPRMGLPYWASVSCLDFDDGHGLLLIGTDAGQFCLVNIANTLLPDEAIHGGLPAKDYLGNENISKVALNRFDLHAWTETLVDSLEYGYPNLLFLSRSSRI